MSNCASCQTKSAAHECGNACGTYYCSEACAEHDWHVGNHFQTCIGIELKDVKPAIMQIMLNTPFEELATVAQTSQVFASVYASFVFRKAYALKHRAGWYAIIEQKLNFNLPGQEFDVNAFFDFCQWFRILIVENVIDSTRLEQDPEVFLLASGAGLYTMCQDMLINKVDPTFMESLAFLLAIMGGYTKLVKLLLVHPKVNPNGLLEGMFLGAALMFDRVEIFKVLCLLKGSRMVNVALDDNALLVNACTKGQAEIVQILLDLPPERGVEPQAQRNKPLRNAVLKGHAKIVDILLKSNRVDPGAWDSLAFVEACIYGHVDIVQRLLRDDRVSPSARDYESIKKAAFWGNLDVVKLLLTRINIVEGANAALTHLLDHLNRNDGVDDAVRTRINAMIDYLQFVLREEEGNRKKARLVEAELVGKKAKSISKKKAREILHHGTVHGHPLTDQQRSYFAWLAFK